MCYKTVFGAVPLAVLLALAPAQPDPTFLGVVDAEGRLTPIAVYDGVEWWNRWPWEASGGEVSRLPVPSSVDAIPADWLPPGLKLPVSWRVLRNSGDLVAVRALGLERSPDHALMSTFVVRTTYRSRRDDNVDELVAIAGPGRLVGFVAPGRAESERILRQLTARIETLERAELEKWIAEREAKDVPTLTRVYMVSTPERTDYVTERPKDSLDVGLIRASARVNGLIQYYIDGEKLFEMGSLECMLNLSVEGVVETRPGGAVASERLRAHAYAEYCGGRASQTYQVGILQLGNRTFWIARDKLEDGYDYLLFDPKSNDGPELKGEWWRRSESR